MLQEGDPWVGDLYSCGTAVVQLSRALMVEGTGRECSQVESCWCSCSLCVFPSSRMISLSRDYACKRVAFGKLLKDHPLHVQTIARMEVRLLGAQLDLLGGKEGRGPVLLVSTASLPALRFRRPFLLQPSGFSKGVVLL